MFENNTYIAQEQTFPEFSLLAKLFHKTDLTGKVGTKSRIEQGIVSYESLWRKFAGYDTFGSYIFKQICL